MPVRRKTELRRLLPCRSLPWRFRRAEWDDLVVRRLWESGRGGKAALAVLVAMVIGAAAFFGLLPTGAPDPVAASAPPEQFSSARALEHVRVVAAAPHPMGSPQNEAVRGYLVEELSALGLRAEVQEATAVRFGIDGLVAGKPKNVLARVEGESGGENAFLLVAHYDSVPTGPGASDDGAGVATMLETARALKAGPSPTNDVIFLFTDGEERGLLGAQAFSNNHPWASDVRVVLNLEARGNTGAARLFETSEDNGWIIGEFADAVPHPMANSGSTAGYKLSGSDTDLTVFMDAGVPGLNIAYLEGLTHYHTRLDTVEELDERSLQHLGSYTLALTRQFGNASLNQPKASDAVFFSILGFMVHYPSAWVIPLMVVAVLLFIMVLALGLKKRELTLGGIGLGFLALLAAVICTALSSYLLWMLIRTLNPTGDVWALQYHAVRHWLGFASLTVAVMSGLYVAFGRRIRVANLAAGALVWWLLSTVLTGMFFPPASFGVVWPLIFSLLGLGTLFLLGDRSTRPLMRFAALALTAVPAILVYAPAIHGMTLIAGLLLTPIVPVFGVVIALLLGLLIPHLDLIARPNRWILPSGAAFIGLGLLLISTLTTEFDAGHPRPNSILYAMNADTRSAIWASYDASVDEWTSQFLGSNPVKGSVTDHLPNASQPLLHSQAPPVTLASPTVRFLDNRMVDGARTLRARVTGPPGATLLTVTTHTQIMGATLDGVRVLNLSDEDKGEAAWNLTYWSPPPEGFELILTIADGERVTVTATAGTPELPAIPGGTYHDRPSHMMPIAEDTTMVSRSFNPHS